MRPYNIEGFISFMKESEKEIEKLNKGLNDIIKYISMTLFVLSVVLFIFNLEY
ncbi:MAG: hypothetical protein ACRC30_07670 [Clostridium sp.]